MIYAFVLATAVGAVKPKPEILQTDAALQLRSDTDHDSYSGDGDTRNTWIHGYKEEYMQKTRVPFVETLEEPLSANNNSLIAVHNKVPHVNITVPPCQIGKNDFDTILTFIIIIATLQVLLISVFISFICIQRTWHYKISRTVE